MFSHAPLLPLSVSSGVRNFAPPPFSAFQRTMTPVDGMASWMAPVPEPTASGTPPAFRDSCSEQHSASPASKTARRAESRPRDFQFKCVSPRRLHPVASRFLRCRGEAGTALRITPPSGFCRCDPVVCNALWENKTSVT